MRTPTLQGIFIGPNHRNVFFRKAGPLYHLVHHGNAKAPAGFNRQKQGRFKTRTGLTSVLRYVCLFIRALGNFLGHKIGIQIQYRDVMSFAD